MGPEFKRKIKFIHFLIPDECISVIWPYANRYLPSNHGSSSWCLWISIFLFNEVSYQFIDWTQICRSKCLEWYNISEQFSCRNEGEDRFAEGLWLHSVIVFPSSLPDPPQLQKLTKHERLLVDSYSLMLSSSFVGFAAVFIFFCISLVKDG